MIAGLDPTTAIAVAIGLMIAMTTVLVIMAVQGAGSRRYTRRLQEVTLRKTVPAATSEMLAKHGIGDGPVDVRTLDAALAGLSLEQRIAVKSQLLRAGAIA